MTDPFATPQPIASAFASADSFRGRLVLIQPTSIERNVPKQAGVPNGPSGDKITATVTVVDGKGPVQIFAQRVATGKFLNETVHRGVWFNQDRITKGLQDVSGNLVPMVLATFETFKPGQMAGQGNPWGLVDPTEADKQTAREFLAAQMVGGAAAPTQAAPAAAPAGDDEAPF